MKEAVFIFLLLLTGVNGIFGQACPGCVIDPSAFSGAGPEDVSIDPSTLAVVQGTYHDEDLSFLMPTEVDPGAGIGNATVTNVKILAVQGLPVGLNWTCNNSPNCNYDPRVSRYGCNKICGTTYVSPGTYSLVVKVRGTGTLSGVSQSQDVSIPLTMEVLPATGGNPGFTFSPTSGCDTVEVDFESLVTSPNPTLIPINYSWDYGNGTSGTGITSTATYHGSGIYLPELTVNIYELYVTSLSASVNGQWWCQSVPFVGCLDGTSTSPDIYFNYSTTGGTSGSGSEKTNTKNPSWSNLNLLVDGVITVSFFDADDIDSDDNGGSTSITVNGPGTYSFSTSGVSGSLVVSTKLQSASIFSDTVEVFESPAPSSITNISGSDSICTGDTVILVSSPAASYIWTRDDTFFVSNDSFIVVDASGSYTVRTTQAANSCDALSAPYQVYVFTTPPVPVLAFNPSDNALTVGNADTFDVKWYLDDSLIAVGVDSIMIAGAGPYYAELSSSGVCAAVSNPFSLCIPGSADLLSVDTFGCCSRFPNVVTTSSLGFSLNPGNIIAWGISSVADGAIDSDADVQTAEGAGRLFLTNPDDSIDLSLCDLNLTEGAYYLTPFAINNPVIDSIPHFPSDTFCLGTANICPVITGDPGWIIDSLIFEFPDGSSLDVLGSFGLPSINQALLDILGGLPCFNLRDLFRGDPNGVWSLTAHNSGTGSLEVEVPAFAFNIYADTCQFLSNDFFVQISGQSTTINPGETKTASLQIPPLPGSFPSIDPICQAFGTPVQFYFKDCVDAIDEAEADLDFTVYPNPSTGDFSLEFSSESPQDFTIGLVDMAGRGVILDQLKSFQGMYLKRYLLEQQPDGIYFIQLSTPAARVIRKLIILGNKY